MFNRKYQWSACGLALAGAVALSGFTAQAQQHHGHDEDGRLGTIFVIAMENHNWTQPAGQTSPQQIFRNPNAPFINSLVNGTSGISDQVSYASNYINAAVGNHPSEPNYIWAEAGTNFNVNNDNDPCGVNGTQQNTDQHLSAFLMKKNISWKSYQEDTDIDLTSNTVLPMSSWIVPLVSHSGTFTVAGALNFYNYSNQFNYAGKHNPMIYFSDTAGGCDTSTANPTAIQLRPAPAVRARPAERHPRRLQLDYAQPVQRSALGAVDRLRRDWNAPHRHQGRLRRDRAGRQLPGPRGAADHGVRRVQAPRRDPAVVGRKRGRRRSEPHAAVHCHLARRAQERGR